MKVCVVSEGCYPFLRGGLSSWAHLLMKSMADIDFDVFCISPTGHETPVYEKLGNQKKILIRPLVSGSSRKDVAALPRQVSRELSRCLRDAMIGAPLDFETLIALERKHHVSRGWLNSRDYWSFVVDLYKETYPDGPFVEYFWTVLGLSSIVLDALDFTNQVPKADVYHALSAGHAGFVASIAKAASGTPLVITEQGIYLKERENELSRLDMSDWYRDQVLKFSESIVKTSYKYADRIVPPCQSHVMIERELGADLGKVKVIDNGIEVEKFPPGPARNGSKPVIGCFARIVPIKGITVLIKAARIVLEKHDVQFYVIGEVQNEDYYRECLQLAAEFGLGDNFVFTGHVEPLPWYHRTDIFTLSSLSEGVPYALLEAMSCGLPCVCTAVGGVPEIVANGVGYVVPPEQPEKLAERLIELIENRELRNIMGQRGIEVADRKYRIGHMAAEFRNEYEVLANGRASIRARNEYASVRSR